MSPETVLLPPAPAAPQPPLAPASVAASSPNAGNPGPAAASSAAQAEGASPGPAPHHERGGSAGRSGSRKTAAPRSPEAPKESRRTKAHAAGSAPQTAQSGANFSQTLAQSLAAHHPAPSVDAAAGAAKPEAKDRTAHASAKDGKTDPVQSALVLVSHGIASSPVPAANVSTGTNGEKAQGVSVAAAGRDPTSAVKALLTHALTQDAKALTATPGGSSTASAHAPAQTSPSSTTAALGATQLGVASHLATRFNAAAAPASALSAPVGTDAWTEELGSRVTWMTHQGIQSASLHLSPEHLGPLQVNISVHHGQASVWFGAAHDETRQALERALPQLRQMLSNQGLTLTDSGVSRDSPRERAPQQGGLGSIETGASAASDGVSGAASVRVGLVDAYA